MTYSVQCLSPQVEDTTIKTGTSMQKQPTQASTRARAHAHAATGGGHSNAHGHDHACNYPQSLLQVSPYFGQCRVVRRL